MIYRLTRYCGNGPNEIDLTIAEDSILRAGSSFAPAVIAIAIADSRLSMNPVYVGYYAVKLGMTSYEIPQNLTRAMKAFDTARNAGQKLQAFSNKGHLDDAQEFGH